MRYPLRATKYYRLAVLGVARIAIAIYPTIFIWATATYATIPDAAVITTWYTAVNMVGLIAKGGIDLHINKILSGANPPYAILAIISYAVSRILKIVVVMWFILYLMSLYSDAVPQTFSPLLFIPAAFSIAIIWAYMAMAQHFKCEIVVLIVSWSVMYVPGLAYLLFVDLPNASSLIYIFVSCSFFSTVLTFIVIIFYEKRTTLVKARPSAFPQLDAYLWISSSLNHAYIWIIQFFGFLVLSAEDASKYALLLRYNSIPAAGLVAVLYIAQRRLSEIYHGGNARDAYMWYIRSCVVSFLAALTTYPIVYFLAALNGQLDGLVWHISWLFGVLFTAMGPLHVFLNVYNRSRQLFYTKLAVLVLSLVAIASMEFILDYLYIDNFVVLFLLMMIIVLFERAVNYNSLYQLLDARRDILTR